MSDSYGMGQQVYSPILGMASHFWYFVCCVFTDRNAILGVIMDACRIDHAIKICEELIDHE